MYSSGITAIATSGAGNTTLVSVPAGGSYNAAVVINEGSVAGFASVDGGNTWARVSAGASASSPSITVIRGRSNSSVLLKRDGGADMSGVYAYCTEIDLR